jgi:hypothetical protein
MLVAPSWIRLRLDLNRELVDVEEELTASEGGQPLGLHRCAEDGTRWRDADHRSAVARDVEQIELIELERGVPAISMMSGRISH